MAILLIAALPTTVLIEFAARAVWTHSPEPSYVWTFAETFSALAFSYVLSLPMFLAVGVLHQVVLLLLGARTEVFDNRAARVALGLIAFGPPLISVRGDLHIFFALLSGAIIYSFAAGNPGRPTSQRMGP